MLSPPTQIKLLMFENGKEWVGTAEFTPKYACLSDTILWLRDLEIEEAPVLCS